MKVETHRKEVVPAFVPIKVSVTLETSDELEALAAICKKFGSIPAIIYGDLDKLPAYGKQHNMYNLSSNMLARVFRALVEEQ